MANFINDDPTLATPTGFTGTVTNFGDNLLLDLYQAADDTRTFVVDRLGTELVQQLAVKTLGAVGTDTNPEYRLVVRVAGINRAELAIDWRSDENPTWTKIWGQEVTGTSAAVRDGTLGSLLEGFRVDGAEKPQFRINSYPSPGIEFMANGGQCPPGNVTRTGGSTVTAFVEDSTGTPIPHGFGVGMTVYQPHVDPLFPAGNFVVTAVPGFDNFQYTQAGSNGVNTVEMDYSAEFDVEVRRFDPSAMGFYVGGARKFAIYPDSMTTEDSIRLSTAGSLETRKFLTVNAGNTPQTPGVVFGVSCDTSGAAVVVNLPAASSCPGRHYAIKKIDAANTVTINRAGSDTIDGATSVTLTAQWEYVYIVSDGTATWWVLGS